MAETLAQKQWRFLRYVGELIAFAEREGYALTGGELFRTPEQAVRNAATGAGIKMSLHTVRLAIDVNLFIDGKYRPDSEAYEPLGIFWESLHPDCRWGGRFRRPDGNHFSLQHDGRA
jgi:hypothetical protein